MARRTARRSLRGAAAAAGLVALLCVTVPGRGFSEEAKDQMKKTAKVWKQPHAIRVAGSDFAVETISQGSPQWQVRATETNGSTALFAARENGGGVAYGINYDSAKSRWAPPEGRVAFAATGNEDSESLDWTLQVDGKTAAPQRFAVSGDGKDIVYDATLAAERPLRGGVSALVAVDAKRRADAEGLLPNWIKPSFGAKYSTSATDYKVAVYPDFEEENATFDWEASMKGHLEGWSTKKGGKILSTDPQYNVRLSQDGLVGKVRAPSKLGTAFGLDGAVDTDGKYDVQGYAEWKGKREVAKGITVDADMKAAAKKGSVDLSPLGAGATVDLGAIAPKWATAGSTVGLRSRYKFGADRPALAAAATLSPAKVPELSATGVATLDDDSHLSGALRVTATKLRGVDARYEMTADGSKARQAAEIRSPRVDFNDGSYLRLTGKAYKGEDWGEKPRVQLGVQYEGKVDIMGRSLNLGGESAGFDSGRSLLDEMGRPWTSPELKKATNTANVVRRRIKTDYGEGRRWISK